jgi:diguanylate cyclase (GGDEF)-like protein
LGHNGRKAEKILSMYGHANNPPIPRLELVAPAGRNPEQAVMQSGDRGLFLATAPANRREVRLALVAVLASGAIFIASVPFSTIKLAAVPAFIPAYQSALIVCDLITAVLLFGQFRFLRSPGLLVLASGYLFTAAIASVHALTFPGVFSPTGLLGAGPQSTAWLYTIWHVAFPSFVLAYAALKQQAPHELDASQPANARSNRTILVSIAAVLILVGAVTALVTAGHELLPVLLVNDRFAPTLVGRVFIGCILCIAAIALLWVRRPRTVLDLWLIVVMCVWLFDIGLSAGFNASRFDIGWYGGRVYGLVAASWLLIVLLNKAGKQQAELAALSAQLSLTNKTLEQQSLHDGLTGLANRRFFDTYLANQMGVARRPPQRTMALILLDIDLFKAYNDRYGHVAGDECLKEVAEVLQSCCRRPADMAARYGGEEFAIILPDTDWNGAIQIAENARCAVAQLQIPHAGSPATHFVAISGGVAVFDPRANTTAAELIAVADKALFRAKSLGRNRIASERAEHGRNHGTVTGHDSMRPHIDLVS